MEGQLIYAYVDMRGRTSINISCIFDLAGLKRQAKANCPNVLTLHLRKTLVGLNVDE